MRTKTLSALIAILAGAMILLPTIAFGGAQAAATHTHTVTLKNLEFHPGTVSIHRGDSVRWVWRDGETEHNVTGHGFRSRTQSRGSFTVRFTHAGTFRYECTIHVAEGMTGKIVVH
jgi:plastocyanin